MIRYIVLGILVVFAVFFFVILPRSFDSKANGVFDQPLPEPSAEARALHAQLTVVDLHCDLLLWKRNPNDRGDRGHVDFPRMREGNLGVQAFTIVSKVPAGLITGKPTWKWDIITMLGIAQLWPPRTWGSYKQRALYQAEKMHRFIEQAADSVLLLKSRGDLDEYRAARLAGIPLLAGWIGVEGMQVLEGELDNVDAMFDAGIRMMAPTHFLDTELGGSAHDDPSIGLTDFGRQVIARMEERGILLDLAHASPKLIDEALEIVTKPVVVSHTGVKGTCDNVRNLSDEHIAQIAATGGVIGVAFFEWAVCGRDVESIVRAIDHVVSIAGVDHVALGSDFDGAVSVPFDAANMVVLTDALLRAGYSAEDIRKIMGENTLRVLQQVLPE